MQDPEKSEQNSPFITPVDSESLSELSNVSIHLSVPFNFLYSPYKPQFVTHFEKSVYNDLF